MASPGGNISPPESIISPQIFVAGLAGVIFFSIGFYQLSSKPGQDSSDDEEPSLVKSFLLFCYSCFLKPQSHAAAGSQQNALESFYAGQAGAVRRRVSAAAPRKKRRLTRRAVRCNQEGASQRPRGHAGARRRTAPIQGREAGWERGEEANLG